VLISDALCRSGVASRFIPIAGERERDPSSAGSVAGERDAGRL
jgi:hypothetical protein